MTAKIVEDYGVKEGFKIRRIIVNGVEGIDISVYTPYGDFNNFEKHGIFVPLRNFDSFVDFLQVISIDMSQKKLDFSVPVKEGDKNDVKENT